MTLHLLTGKLHTLHDCIYPLREARYRLIQLLSANQLNVVVKKLSCAPRKLLSINLIIMRLNALDCRLRSQLAGNKDINKPRTVIGGGEIINH